VGPSWPFRGGIARTTTHLASALAARGSLAAFCVPRRQYPGWLYPGRGDRDESACTHLEQASESFSVLEPWTWPRVVGELRGARPEAVVLPYWTAAWAPFERYLQSRVGVPVVVVAHNAVDHEGSWLNQVAARGVLRRAAGIFCHANSVAAVLAGELPAIPRAVHPLPPDRPVEADRELARRRLGVPPGAVAVLCFGLIRPYKGVDVLLEALARIPVERDVVVLLAGEPWRGLGESLRSQLARPVLSGRVVSRLSWVPEADAGDWFAAADIVALPYRAATGSAVAAQALGWGVPVVGSAVGGIGDVVTDGVNGLLVPPGDPDALAAALESVVDPALRSRLAFGMRETAGRWSWASYAAALENLVTAALGNGRSPG
jgi:glycosyltransferase involved in cell wall biosynthesis